jgi:hypothetical protein
VLAAAMVLAIRDEPLVRSKQPSTAIPAPAS